MGHYIAMNRFKITIGRESDFENIWKNRDTYLNDVTDGGGTQFPFQNVTTLAKKGLANCLIDNNNRAMTGWEFGDNNYVGEHMQFLGFRNPYNSEIMTCDKSNQCSGMSCSHTGVDPGQTVYNIQRDGAKLFILICFDDEKDSSVNYVLNKFNSKTDDIKDVKKRSELYL